MRNLAILLLLATPLAAFASPTDRIEAEVQAAVSARYSRAYDRCMKAAVGTFDMKDCSWEEVQRQDVPLNRVYRALLGRLPRAEGARLRASERAWIRNTDKNCEREHAEPRAMWGAAQRLMYASCFLDSTIRRTVWLERYRDGRATLSDLNR